MHRRAVGTAVAFVTAVLCGGCAVVPSIARPGYVRELALPAELAGALAAAALRQAFPFADPFACAAGAPGERTAAGCRIVYELTRDGHWLPVARQRLRITAMDPTGPAIVVAEQLVGEHVLRPLGATAIERIEVIVDADGTGASRVCARLPDDLAATLADGLDRAFALATEDSAPALGLAEPNLRALVRHRLLRAAAELLRAGDPQRAGEHLHRASRVLDGATADQRCLGALAARTGDADLARDHLLQAMLVSTDPTTRADLAAALTAATQGAPILTGIASALQMHSERRAHPRPARDYEQLVRVHAQRHDDMGELACALLAREHTPGVPTRLAITARSLARQPFDLARRARIDFDAFVAETAARGAGAAAQPAR